MNKNVDVAGHIGVQLKINMFHYNYLLIGIYF